MSTWNRTDAPTWQPGAEADQNGWAEESTGEILVSTKPTAVNVNFLNQKERAQALAWVKAGLLIPSEAGLTGALASVVVIDTGYGFTAQPAITVVGDGTLGVVNAVLETEGNIVSVTLNVGGGGADYVVGDELLLPDTGTGAKIVVDTVDGLGEILTFTQVQDGNGYVANGVAVAPVTVYTTTVGTGALFDTTVGFRIASINVTTPGTEYVPDTTTLTIAGGTTAEAKPMIATIGSGDFATMESLAISRM